MIETKVQKQDFMKQQNTTPQVTVESNLLFHRFIPLEFYVNIVFEIYLFERGQLCQLKWSPTEQNSISCLLKACNFRHGRQAKFNSHSSFPIFPDFLPNPGRILPALTFNGCDPLYVNADRILPGFGRKL